LYHHDPRFVEYGDKLLAKNFTTSDIHSIPTIAVDPVTPPDYPVVAKVNNRSGSVSVIRNYQEWENFLNRIPSTPYGTEKGEWHYREMSTHIYLEPVIENFVEVKFFCFGGKVKYLYLVEPTRKTFFTAIGGEPLAVQQGAGGKIYIPTKFPSSLPTQAIPLIPEVEKLAVDFPHARIDLMITRDKTYLSEFTFFHLSGMINFKPKSFDHALGESWILPQAK